MNQSVTSMVKQRTASRFSSLAIVRLHEKVSLLALYYNLPDNTVSSTGGIINDDISSTGGFNSGTLLFSSIGTIMIQKYSITVLIAHCIENKKRG